MVSLSNYEQTSFPSTKLRINSEFSPRQVAFGDRMSGFDALVVNDVSSLSVCFSETEVAPE